MNRKSFLQSLGLLTLTTTSMKVNALHTLSQSLRPTARMPVLFFGHGSPMNAMENNVFTQKWNDIGAQIPKPQAVLCISAHWETKGTFVTAMPNPKMIHDFGGFPEALFQVQYPAPGNPALASEVKHLIKKTEVGLNEDWGLDHGTWSVVKHLYPQADIPVLQMSLDYSQAPAYHYALAKELAELRDKGVLIIGSGNIVHNLRLIAWDQMHTPGYGFDWALEANEKMKKMMLAGDHTALINYKTLGKAFALAIPSPDHYLPLLYILALQKANEKISIFNDQAMMGSLTMTSLQIGD